MDDDRRSHENSQWINAARTCWVEALDSAMRAVYPTEQQLEFLLGRLERTP